MIEDLIAVADVVGAASSVPRAQIGARGGRGDAHSEEKGDPKHLVGFPKQ